MAITELFPKRTSFDNTIEYYALEGYDIFLTDLETGRGYGNLHKTMFKMQWKLKFDSNFNESIWCEIKLKDNDILLIGCIYRSPSSPNDKILDLKQLMNKAITCNMSHLLIMGDFNLKEIDWHNHTTNVGLNHPATIFLEVVRDLFLVQHVNENTRYRENNIPLHSRFDINK